MMAGSYVKDWDLLECLMYQYVYCRHESDDGRTEHSVF